MNFDLLVAGESVAGIGAVLEARRLGLRVGLVGVCGEQVLRGRFGIGPTPLNPQMSEGHEFEEFARQALARAEATWLENCEAIALRQSDRDFMCELDDVFSKGPTRVHAARLLLATRADLDPRAKLPEFAAHFGRGLSLCAWSDSVFYKGQCVVVSGDGRLAADQALFALGHGCEVVLVSSRGQVSAPEWMHARLREHGPRFRQRADEILGVHGDGDLDLESLQLRTERLPCKALFLAQPHPDPWQALGPELGAAKLRDARGFGVAGALEGASSETDTERFEQGVSAIRRLFNP